MDSQKTLTGLQNEKTCFAVITLGHSNNLKNREFFGERFSEVHRSFRWRFRFLDKCTVNKSSFPLTKGSAKSINYLLTWNFWERFSTCLAFAKLPKTSKTSQQTILTTTIFILFHRLSTNNNWVEANYETTTTDVYNWSFGYNTHPFPRLSNKRKGKHKESFNNNNIIIILIDFYCANINPGKEIFICA